MIHVVAFLGDCLDKDCSRNTLALLSLFAAGVPPCRFRRFFRLVLLVAAVAAVEACQSVGCHGYVMTCVVHDRYGKAKQKQLR